MSGKATRLRARHRLGKYRIEGRLAAGPYATVYAAMDTIEGVRVALKIPNDAEREKEALSDFKREVRLAARLFHPNILPLKDASFVDGHFVIVTPLGEETLAARLSRRMALATMIDLSEQFLDALAYAHGERVLHCDIKPENLILFPDNHLVLADFGIAKHAQRTVKASGSGTLGYLAPEQAMGRPSPRSDVFAAGLLLYRMYSGHLPEWPFHWPPAGIKKLSGRVSPAMVEFLRRALDLEPARRFRDAQQMYSAFREVKRKGIAAGARKIVRGNGQPADWRAVQYRQFQRFYGRALQTQHQCKHCSGPIAESMQCCPWCGQAQKKFAGETTMPACCPHCNRGVKLDWRYCASCYGGGFEVETDRHYADRRYVAHCARPSCAGPLMPFMRYCPWCHARTTQKWQIKGVAKRCRHCGWGVVTEHWTVCPWCTKQIQERS